MDCRGATSWADLQSIVPGSVGGWMSMHERERLFQFAKQMQPGQRFLEIGVFGGTTLSIFALMTEDVEIIGLDSWENDTPSTSPIDGRQIDVKTLCLENLQLNGITEKVKLLSGSSHDLGPQWTAPLDFLIIDGDHTEDGAYQDLHDFAPHVVPGGIMLVDDYCAGQVRAATDRYLSKHGKEWIIEHVYQNENDGKFLTLRKVP